MRPRAVGALLALAVWLAGCTPVTILELRPEPPARLLERDGVLLHVHSWPAFLERRSTGEGVRNELRTDGIEVAFVVRNMRDAPVVLSTREARLVLAWHDAPLMPRRTAELTLAPGEAVRVELRLQCNDWAALPARSPGRLVLATIDGEPLELPVALDDGGELAWGTRSMHQRTAAAVPASPGRVGPCSSSSAERATVEAAPR